MADYNTEIRERKNMLREEYRAKRRALSREEQTLRDEKIARCLLSSMSYRSAGVLLLYASTEEEIATERIARQALADGKKIAYPRCHVEERQMVFHLVDDPAMLAPGSYDLSEPDETLPVYDYENRSDTDHAIALIPGVVFDRAGFRVGYGKGYYDRFLRGFGGVRIGLVYADHILKEVPRGRFDMNVDVLITEKGVTAANAK